LVVGDSPCFIELNPRVTTSFVALAQVLRENLGEILINALMDGATIPRPRLNGCSLLRIPKAKRSVKIDIKKLDGLREIPGVISPPLAFKGVLREGSSLFVIAESGNTARHAQRKVEITLNEAATKLGVDGDAITWS
jgi:predicted ATP-grasp superfamily ATP-dependent carboligase